MAHEIRRASGKCASFDRPLLRVQHHVFGGNADIHAMCTGQVCVLYSLLSLMRKAPFLLFCVAFFFSSCCVFEFFFFPKHIISRILSSDRILVDSKGGIAFSHILDPNFDITDAIVAMRAEGRPAASIYWR